MEKFPEDQNKKEPWDWKEYYELIGEKAHTKYLEEAVSYCQSKDYALDIGAGNLRDSKFLLNIGFNVTSIDPSPLSKEFAEKLNSKSLTMFSDTLNKFDFPENKFSLVNAQGFIFHIHKDNFIKVINNIKKTLKEKGVLCADFIGEKDDWNNGGNKSILTKENLDFLKQNFDIKYLEEFERDETQEVADKKALYKDQDSYKPKHWHHINIIGIKK